MTPDDISGLARDLLHQRDTTALERIRALYTRLQPAAFDDLLLQIVDCWTRDRVFSNSEIVLRKMMPLVNPAILPELLELYRTPHRNQQVRSRLMWLLGEHPHPRARLFWLAQHWSTASPFFHQLNRLIDTLLAEYPSVYEFVTCCLDHLDKPLLKLEAGTQSFSLLWGETLRLVDSAGKQYKALPTPDEHDNPILMIQAEQTWQHSQSLSRQLTLIVTAIWERAMLDAYRWTRSQFKRLFWEHPQTQQLAQRLIWGVYQHNRLAATFRIGEDFLLTTAHDQPYTLPHDHVQIGVVHPFHLSETERIAWNTLLNDYQIMPLFPQMQRSIYALLPDELPEATQLTRSPILTNRVRLRSPTIARVGWESGWENTLTRRFGRQHDFTIAHVILRRLSGYEYEVQGAWFNQGTDKAAMSLGAVPPLVLSETVYIMQQLKR